MSNDDYFYTRIFNKYFDKDSFRQYVQQCYPHEIKRFMAVCDLGEGPFQLDEQQRLKDPIKATADCLIKTLSRTWPPPLEFAGIGCKVWLLPVIKKVVELDAFDSVPGELYAALSEMSVDFFDSELAEIAVNADGATLDLIDEKLVTRSLALKAVTGFPDAINSVPKQYLDETFISEAVAQNYEVGCRIPRSMQSAEVVRQVMRSNPSLIMYMNVEHLDFDMCYSAVAKNGHSLRHVPEKYRTNDLIMLALADSGHALSFIERENVTVEMVMTAMRERSGSLSFAPYDLIGGEILEALIECEDLPADCIHFVPAEYQTERLIEKVIEVLPVALGYVHHSRVTFKHQLMAVKADRSAIMYVPEGLQKKVLEEVDRQEKRARKREMTLLNLV